LPAKTEAGGRWPVSQICGFASAYAVWNVEARRSFLAQPKAWWYPLVGSLEYRGYFSERNARAYAERLRARGYDVYAGGVEAYRRSAGSKTRFLEHVYIQP